MRYSTVSRRPTIGLGSRCTIHERDRFEQLCKKNGITMLKGINLLVRQAISKDSLPMEYDNVDWLLDQAQTYKFVCWFNK